MCSGASTTTQPPGSTNSCPGTGSPSPTLPTSPPDPIGRYLTKSRQNVCGPDRMRTFSPKALGMILRRRRSSMNSRSSRLVVRVARRCPIGSRCGGTEINVFPDYAGLCRMRAAGGAPDYAVCTSGGRNGRPEGRGIKELRAAAVGGRGGSARQEIMMNPSVRRWFRAVNRHFRGVRIRRSETALKFGVFSGAP